MTSRLARWRDRNGLKAETVATLCGFSVDRLQQYETGAHVERQEDVLALTLLFDDAISIGTLLTSRMAEDEETVLEEMDAAFRRTMLAWKR